MKKNKQEPGQEKVPAHAETKENKIVVMSPMQYEEAVRNEKLPVGIVSGLAAGLACAVLWAVITIVTGYQAGVMALAVGAAVGFTLRKTGKGISPKFGVAGAVIALLSCLIGNALTLIVHMAPTMNFGYAATFEEFEMSLMFDTFDVIDIVFYALAVAEGYKFAFTKVEVRA